MCDAFAAAQSAQVNVSENVPKRIQGVGDVESMIGDDKPTNDSCACDANTDADTNSSSKAK